MPVAIRCKAFLVSVFMVWAGGWAHADEFPFFAKPNRDHVRVRTDSTTQSLILGELKTEAVVNVISEKWDWFQIRLPSEFPGYVHSAFVRTTPDKGSIISADHVNIRAHPSREAPILGQVKRNTPVHVMGTQGDWVSIQALPTFTAYVHSRLVTPVHPREILREGATP